MPPVNDDFANRIVLTGASGTTTGSNVGATLEAGEPAVDTPGDGVTGTETVWWEWTAPASGMIQLDTFGSTEPGGSVQLDTVLDVWTGASLGALTLVAANDDGGSGVNSLVTFSAVAGTTYYIRVNDYGGTPGDIVLNWGAAVIPAITSLSPTAGLWGDLITATGTDMGMVTAAHFGALGTVPAITVTSTTVTFQVPSGNGGTYPVSVIAPSGESNTLPFDVQGPTISSLAPSHDIVAATPIINGAGFANVLAIHFGSVSATSWTVLSRTQVRVSVPSGLVPGSIVTVTVTTFNGTSNGLPFTVDYHTIFIVGVSLDRVIRGCEFVISGGFIEEAQGVRVGSTDCPDFYYSADDGYLHVKVPDDLPLDGRQDVSVLDGLGAWASWHGGSSAGATALSLIVVDQDDMPFLALEQAAGLTGKEPDNDWPYARHMRKFAVDGNQTGALGPHAMAGFVASSDAGPWDLQVGLYYFDPEPGPPWLALGASPNVDDSWWVSAIGDSLVTGGGGSTADTYVVVAYHEDSGLFGQQKLQVVKLHYSNTSAVPALIGSPSSADLQLHDAAFATLMAVPLSTHRFATVANAAGVVGADHIKINTYSANLTTGALTLLATTTTAAAEIPTDVYPIDGSSFLVQRHLNAGGDDLSVVSVDLAGAITIGGAFSAAAAGETLLICPDLAGTGFWGLVSTTGAQYLDHYSIAAGVVSRDSRVTITTDDGTVVNPVQLVAQTSDRGDVVAALGVEFNAGGTSYGEMSWVIDTVTGLAGPVWFAIVPGFGTYGLNIDQRAAINLVQGGLAGPATSLLTSVVWMPTTGPSAGGDLEPFIGYAAFDVVEETIPCLPYTPPARWHIHAQIIG